MKDAGREILIDGLKQSIADYDEHKKADKTRDLHCKADNCTVGPYAVSKMERLDTGQNLILRWILIQENNSAERMNYDNDQGDRRTGAKISLFGGRVFAMSGIPITGRDLLIIVMFICVAAVALKEYIPVLLK